MELELKDYVQIFMKRLWLIAAVVVVTTVITGIISFYYVQPVYEANAKIIVNKSAERQGVQYVDPNTINASIMLINTYKEIIKTPAIMDKVLERYPDIKLSAGQLASRVSVNSTNETQVITLTSKDLSYNQAVLIVNAVVEVFKQEIPAIMNVDNVTILNKAKEMANPSPVKHNPMNNIVLSFLVSLMVSLGIAFLLEYLDDTIKSDREIESYLGIPTLAVITKIKSKDLYGSSSTNQQRMVGETTSVKINQ
ncbi:lipopolysaccharide biosynthesis protein [Paenibacillus sp. SYP-B3998]|uniref:Lipopolysaccharide biosynthesis protein n=1 Tax=Paenibacillus sp. SYP-B3998 TaxID=2678564 RepID=A0A6G3ZYF5_9BACL|nr:Wzz/FepE/Etk N-terminal domain-containing protein [Paenibacillus sp. SYP-B3998]NEW07145.1 lipopolysaccharide biosynthesis protein [Paenibacillus sp. SYP-B3998]